LTKLGKKEILEDLLARFLKKFNFLKRDSGLPLHYIKVSKFRKEKVNSLKDRRKPNSQSHRSKPFISAFLC